MYTCKFYSSLVRLPSGSITSMAGITLYCTIELFYYTYLCIFVCNKYCECVNEIGVGHNYENFSHTLTSTFYLKEEMFYSTILIEFFKSINYLKNNL